MSAASALVRRAASSTIGSLFAAQAKFFPQRIAIEDASTQLTYAAPNTLVSFGLRSFALQFEDDRNQFLLPGYATLQFAARQRLRKSLWATAAIENLLDREYLTGIPTPTAPTIGGPILWRAGLRWDGPIR